MNRLVIVPIPLWRRFLHLGPSSEERMLARMHVRDADCDEYRRRLERTLADFRVATEAKEPIVGLVGELGKMGMDKLRGGAAARIEAPKPTPATETANAAPANEASP